MLNAHKVNAGVKDAMTDLSRKKDNYQQITQNQLGIAIDSLDQCFCDS